MTELLRHQPISERVLSFARGEYLRSPAFVQAIAEFGDLPQAAVRAGIQIAALRIRLITDPTFRVEVRRRVEHTKIRSLDQPPHTTYGAEIGAVASWDSQTDPHGLYFLTQQQEKDRSTIIKAIINLDLFHGATPPESLDDRSHTYIQGVLRGEDITIDYYRGLIKEQQ